MKCRKLRVLFVCNFSYQQLTLPISTSMAEHQAKFTSHVTKPNNV